MLSTTLSAIRSVPAAALKATVIPTSWWLKFLFVNRRQFEDGSSASAVSSGHRERLEPYADVVLSMPDPPMCTIDQTSFSLGLDGARPSRQAPYPLEPHVQ